MPKRKVPRARSKSSKKSKEEQDSQGHFPSLPWDVWAIILGNLSFLELRKSAFRVCKKFKELTFLVVRELSLPNIGKCYDWCEVMKAFGTVFMYSTNLVSGLHASLQIKTLHIPPISLLEEKFHLFPQSILGSLTKLNISEVGFHSVDSMKNFLEKCSSLVALNAHCKPTLELAPLRDVTPNLTSLCVWLDSYRLGELQQYIPTGLQHLNITISNEDMNKIQLPPIKSLHWNGGGDATIFELPDTIESAVVSTWYMHQIENLLKPLPTKSVGSLAIS